MGAVLEEDNVIVIDNTMNGFDLHSFDTGSYIRTFPTALSSKDRRTPRPVCFGEYGQIVVGGGNDGKIYVFDRRSGATVDTLQHTPESMGSFSITVSLQDLLTINLLAFDRRSCGTGIITSQALLRMTEMTLLSTSGSIRRRLQMQTAGDSRCVGERASLPHLSLYED